MPHRVTNFLRTTSGGIPHIKKPASSSRSTSRSATPDASDSEDQHQHHHHHHHHDLHDAIKKHHHRLSLPFGKSAKDAASGAGARGPASIAWSVESPPVIFHGSSEESSGALVSGLMFLDVRDDVVDVESFTARLTMRTTHRQPYQGNCRECRNVDTELASWKLLVQPTTLRRGRHQYPFSTLLPGHLPATMNTPVTCIDYDFSAEAMVMSCPVSGPATSVKFERSIPVKRSIPEQDIPHNSVRVFPPTNIKVNAHYAGVVHPTGLNNVALKIDGLMTLNAPAETLELWKLKKVSWRLEETIRSHAPSCGAHADTAAAAPGSSDGTAPPSSTLRQETRTIGEKHLHSGWKSEYSGTDGSVEMELNYNVTHFRPYSRELKYACDTRANSGSDGPGSSNTQVSHSLLVELVVSKEYAPEGKPQYATQSGTGRILRMHFAVVMTDYPGMGVSWDNESPPVYQDVPPSPPGYPCECPIEYETIDSLNSRRASLEPLHEDE